MHNNESVFVAVVEIVGMWTGVPQGSRPHIRNLFFVA